MGSTTSQQIRDNIQLDLIGFGYLEKHQKYKELYKPNEIFHGIGIENELYLEFDKQTELSKTQFLENRARERYSVDYNNTYHKDKLEQTLNEYANNFFNTTEKIQIPLLLNAHSFENGDKEGNQKTLYVKGVKENPKYLGQTLTNFCFEQNEMLKSNYGKTFTFDGDTIEFITVNFYNVSLVEVLNELSNSKKLFIENVNEVFNNNNIFKQYGKISIMKQNYPFATHFTNINNYGMFNNGTIHVNLTLPTKLDKIGLIENKEKFIRVHRAYIRYIQIMEPILIGMFGSPDIFSQLDVSLKELYSKGSQRCSVSRYIGVGTYDTDDMMTGKILTKKVNDIVFSKNDFWWYNKFHENSAYKKLDQVGLDINFNKHYNHGIEIRFFDHLEIDQLENAIRCVIYLGDFVLDKQNKQLVSKIFNPGHDKTWNMFTEDVIRHGPCATITNNIINMYKFAFNTTFVSTDLQSLYGEIMAFLKQKYQTGGLFSERCLT